MAGESKLTKIILSVSCRRWFNYKQRLQDLVDGSLTHILSVSRFVSSQTI